MENTIHVKIFEIRENINLPLAENPDKCSNAGIGDHLLCFDGVHVYAKAYDKGKDAFTLLLNDLKFIEMNPRIFDKIG